jgi:hypothetical protein
MTKMTDRNEPAGRGFPTTVPLADLESRSPKMYLIQEDLARAHIRELQEDAAAERIARGLVLVRKAARKADEARLYAKRALASAIAHD